MPTKKAENKNKEDKKEGKKGIFKTVKKWAAKQKENAAKQKENRKEKKHNKNKINI